MKEFASHSSTPSGHQADSFYHKLDVFEFKNTIEMEVEGGNMANNDNKHYSHCDSAVFFSSSLLTFLIASNFLLISRVLKKLILTF